MNKEQVDAMIMQYSEHASRCKHLEAKLYGLEQIVESYDVYFTKALEGLLKSLPAEQPNDVEKYLKANVDWVKESYEKAKKKKAGGFDNAFNAGVSAMCYAMSLDFEP